MLKNYTCRFNRDHDAELTRRKNKIDIYIDVIFDIIAWIIESNIIIIFEIIIQNSITMHSKIRGIKITPPVLIEDHTILFTPVLNLWC